MNVFNEKSFIPGTINSSDDHDHGTHLAGVAALYKSLHPEASPNDAKSYLMTSGTNFTDLCYGNSHSYFVGDRDEFPESFKFRYKIQTNKIRTYIGIQLCIFYKYAYSFGLKQIVININTICYEFYLVVGGIISLTSTSYKSYLKSFVFIIITGEPHVIA